MIKLKLLLASVLTVAAVAVGLTVSSPAWAGAALTCQTRTWTNSIEPADGMYWNTYVDAWRWGDWQVSYCRHAVSWDPEGYRYTGNGVVEVRLRLLNSLHHTQSVGPWMTSFGGGPTVHLARMLAAGQWFQLDFRPVGVPYPPGPSEFWPRGQVQF